MKTPPRLKSIIGTLFGTGVALIAHAIGTWRDEKAGTATLTSRRSRAILASTVFAAGIGELYTGTAAGNASTHIAFTIYTGMRDLMVQSRLRLHNPNTSGIKPDWIHFSIMMTLMTIISGFVNFGMSTLASPSGQAAWTARSSFDEQLKHAVIRGCLNLLGEVGDDFLFQVIPSIRSQLKGVENPHVLRLSLKDVGYHKGYLTNAALGPWAARTGLLATTCALLGIAAPSLANNTKLLEGISDLIVGVSNGPLYEPFANSVSGQPDPVRTAGSNDEESQKDYSQHNDAASIRSYMHPNVDMTNSASVRQWDVNPGHHQPDSAITNFTECFREKPSSIQPSRIDLPRVDDCVSLQSIASSLSESIYPYSLETPTSSVQPINTTNTTNTNNSLNDECTASEEQFEHKQRRKTAGNIVTIDFAALQRNSFHLGRPMPATPMPDIGDPRIFACIQRQARAATTVKVNAYRPRTNMISKTLLFKGCRNFFIARICTAMKLRKRPRTLRPNCKTKEVAIHVHVFNGKLIGVNRQLLIKCLYWIIPVLNSLEQVQAWNVVIKLNRGQTKRPSIII